MSSVNCQPFCLGLNVLRVNFNLQLFDRYPEFIWLMSAVWCLMEPFASCFKNALSAESVEVITCVKRDPSFDHVIPTLCAICLLKTIPSAVHSSPWQLCCETGHFTYTSRLPTFLSVQPICVIYTPCNKVSGSILDPPCPSVCLSSHLAVLLHVCSNAYS